MASLRGAVQIRRERPDDATAVAARAVSAAEAAASDREDARTRRVCFAANREMAYEPCFHLAVCKGAATAW